MRRAQPRQVPGGGRIRKLAFLNSFGLNKLVEFKRIATCARTGADRIDDVLAVRRGHAPERASQQPPRAQRGQREPRAAPYTARASPQAATSAAVRESHAACMSLRLEYPPPTLRDKGAALQRDSAPATPAARGRALARGGRGRTHAAPVQKAGYCEY